MLRSERMTKMALERAYRLRVTKTESRLIFEVLSPSTARTANSRPILKQLTIHNDLVRIMTALRGKYKVPADNVIYVGFEPGEKVGGVIPVRAEDKAQVVIDDPFAEDEDAKDIASVETAEEETQPDVGLQEVSEADFEFEKGSFGSFED